MSLNKHSKIARQKHVQAADLHMEHLNRLGERAITKLRVNETPKAQVVQRGYHKAQSE